MNKNEYDLLMWLINESISEAPGKFKFVDDNNDSDDENSEDDVFMDVNVDGDNDNNDNGDTKPMSLGAFLKKNGINKHLGQRVGNNPSTQFSQSNLQNQSLDALRRIKAGKGTQADIEKSKMLWSGYESLPNANKGGEIRVNGFGRYIRRNKAMEPDKYGRVKIAGKYFAKPANYDFPIMMVCLENIDPHDCQIIYEQIFDSNNTLMVGVASDRVNNAGDGMKIITKGFNFYLEDGWLNNEFNEIIEILKGMNDENGNPKYFKNEQEVQNLRDMANHNVDNPKLVGEYVSKANENNLELYNKFMEAENDEQVRAFMEMYKRTGAIMALCKELNLDVETFGHILSFKNTMLVLGSGRLTGAGVPPTYVLTPNMWLKFFKRRVKPNAVPFIIFVPNKKNRINMIKQPEMTSAPFSLKGMDIRTSDDILNAFYHGVPYKNLSVEQKKQFNVFCNFINPSACFPIKEFDVSDTYPIDPNDDPWEQQIGLINNLNGQHTLNKSAEDFKAIEDSISGINGKSEPEKSDSDDKNYSQKNVNEVEIYECLNEVYQNIIAFCEFENNKYKLDKNKYTIPDTTKKLTFEELQNKTYALLAEIARKKIRLSKPEIVNELVDSAIYFVSKINVLPIIPARRRKAGEHEWTQVQEAVNEMNRAIKFTVRPLSSDGETKSNKGGQIAESRKNIAKILKENKKYVNTFFKILENMDNSKNNLKY